MTTSIIVRAGLAAFIPAIIWLAFIYSREHLERAAKRLVLLLLIGSIGAVIVGAGLEIAILHRASITGGDIVAVAATVGLIEEAAKFGVTFLLTRRSEQLREPVDGVIYASSVAFGFAAFETTLYILGDYRRLLSAGASSSFAAHLALTRVAPVRAVTGSLAHVALAGIVGYAYGRVRTSGGAPVSILWAYLLAAGMHSAYDGLILDRRTGLALLVLLVIVIVFVFRLAEARAASPVRIGQLHLRPGSRAIATAREGRPSPAPSRPDLWFATHTAPGSGLYAWEDPDLTSSLVCAVAAGTEVHETGRKGEWAHISLKDGRSGWVIARLLVPRPPVPPSVARG